MKMSHSLACQIIIKF